MQFLWIVYINELLMGHKKIHFISERGLIEAQIPIGLCRVWTLIFVNLGSTLIWGSHGCVDIVVGFSTTCAISAYHH